MFDAYTLLIITISALIAFAFSYAIAMRKTARQIEKAVEANRREAEQESNASRILLEEQLRQSRTDNVELKQTHAELSKEIINHTQRVNDLTKKLSSAESEAVHAKSQLQDNNTRLADTEKQLNQERKETQLLRSDNAKLHTRTQGLQELAEERHELARKAETLTAELAEQQKEYEKKQTHQEATLQATEEKIASLKNTEERLKKEFENLANRIFDNKSAQADGNSKKQLEAVLAPFRQQIGDFKAQVNKAYQDESLERRSLQKEILGLKDLNQQMAQEALNLTQALKGDNKTQGNWGEMVLESILEQSGLREGQEFELQAHLHSDEGVSRKPDVIVHLPENKDIIIDSKVSLVHYEQHISANTEDERQQALTLHLRSMKGHIKDLGEKRYENLQGVRTLDYILMFVPIEAAFYSAIEQDPGLVQYALDRNIMIVSPTNLLVALRTIQNIWRYEHQNENAKAIAEKAGAMYDKFCNFVVDMEKIGNNLETTHKNYNLAMNKLSTGRGNLVRRAKEFQDLGVKTQKSLPTTLADRSELDTEEVLQEASNN